MGVAADSDGMPLWQHQSVRAAATVGSDPGRLPGRVNARRVAISLLIVGLAVTAIATWLTIDQRTKAAADELAASGELLVFETQGLLEQAEVQIVAGGSLFRASSHVSPDEFQVFVTDIGLMSGILGLGYVPVIPDAELPEWVATTRREVPGLALFELDDNKLPRPLEQRDLRFPLLYFEPFDLFSGIAGLDLGYHDNWYDDLADSLGTEGTIMTTFVELGLPAPLDDEDQFIIGWPIADVSTGEVGALAIALLDLGLLVDGNISEEITDGIEWEVLDVTDGVLPADGVDDSWTGSMNFGGRIWSFSVATADADQGLLNGTPMYLLLGGLAITVLLATVGQLAVSRSGGKRKVEALESLNDSKDAFLAAVSHRLRTPLTAVVGFSELLKDSEIGLTEVDRGELLSTIAVQAIELGHLFDNLLTVTRDTERAVFSRSRVCVTAELHAVLDTLEPGRRAKVRVVAADRDLIAAGDPGLIRQILRNLIANATDFGGVVEVSVIDENHIARVVVKDDGPGVAPHLERSMFDLYSYETRDVGQPESMGVGLFVSRRLARRMSGDITHRRDEPWTVLELTLPAIPAAVSIDLSPLATTVH